MLTPASSLLVGSSRTVVSLAHPPSSKRICESVNDLDIRFELISKQYSPFHVGHLTSISDRRQNDIGLLSSSIGILRSKDIVTECTSLWYGAGTSVQASMKATYTPFLMTECDLVAARRSSRTLSSNPI
jgi:hypothetical protein